jgi:GNAT superfamily N-acetyltransferase
MIAMDATVIRLAEPAEAPRMIEMGEKFHQTSAYSEHVGWDKAKAAILAEKLIADKSLLVIEAEGKPVGMIGLVFFEHFLSAEIVASEVFWWIEPEYRGEGKKLLKAAEDLARERGAKRMQMIAPNERVGILYKRIGYTFVESAYQKTL